MSLLLSLQQGSGGYSAAPSGTTVITYLLNDSSPADAATPLATRAAVPGPGTVTARDTGNHGSIAGGRTVYDGSGVNVADPGEYVTPGLSRASSLGRAIIGCVRLSTNTGTLNIGWANSVAVGASMQSALRIGNGVIQIIAGGSTLTASLSDDIIGHYDAHLEFAVVLRAAGAYCFVRGGAATAWKLVWVDSTDVVATVYPHVDP